MPRPRPALPRLARIVRFARLVTAAMAAFAGDAHAGASAEKPTSSLSWVRLPGAEGCLSAADLAGRVEAKLGRAALVSASAAERSVEARAERLPSGRFRVIVTGSRRDGTTLGSRELEGATCKGLEDGLVLVIALMIDPDAASTAPVPAPAPAPPPPPTPPTIVVQERVVIREVPVSAPVSPAPADASPLEVRPLEALTAAGAAFGRAPGAAVLLVGGLRVPVGRHVAVSLAGEFARSGPHEGASVTTAAALVGVCAETPIAGGLRGGLCAGLRGGAYFAQGSGFSSNRAAADGLFDATLAPELTLPVAGRLFATVAGGLSAPLVTQRLVLAGTGAPSAVFTRPTIGGEVLIGVGVAFASSERRP